MSIPKIIISVASFNEIAGKLEAVGIRIGEGRSINLEKGTALIPDHDLRMVTMRRDAIDIAAKSYNSSIHGADFVTYASKVFEFMFNGEVHQSANLDGTPKGWPKT